MSYITLQDLKDELGEQKLLELADDSGNGSLEDEAVVNRVGKAIGFAIGTFDSYARQRYAVPVPVTEKVKSVCLSLAVFHLYQSRSELPEGVYKVKKDAHDLAMKYLQDVGSGKAALDVPSVEETVKNPASPDEVLRGSSASPVVFSDEKLSGY